MNKDIIVTEDEDVKIIFHFKVFCELLKECISIYGNTTIENALQLVKDFHPLQQPISTTDDVVFFSHENIYHWGFYLGRFDGGTVFRCIMISPGKIFPGRIEGEGS